MTNDDPSPPPSIVSSHGSSDLFSQHPHQLNLHLHHHQQQQRWHLSCTKLTAKPHAFGGAVLSPKHARELTPSLCLAVTAALAEHCAATAIHTSSSFNSAGTAGGGGGGSVHNDPFRPSSAARHTDRVQYTVWITEAWRVLGWAEPSAALFWEMATMLHTLYVAGRAYAAAVAAARAESYYCQQYQHHHDTGTAPTEPGANPRQVAAGGGGGGGEDTSSSLQPPPPPPGIPPILSCGSTSSMGSGKSFNTMKDSPGGTSTTGGDNRPTATTTSAAAAAANDATNSNPHLISQSLQSPSVSSSSASSIFVKKDPAASSGHHYHHHPSTANAAGASASSAATSSKHHGGGGTTTATATASAKELPVWLVGTFLLLHCELTAFLRNVSGEDERRFGSNIIPAITAAGGGGGGGAVHFGAAGTGGAKRTPPGSRGVDFSSLLHHPALSPRTRIHAGMHADNAHCTAYLLRHLRKFLLLCAVPHNQDAVRACIQLADTGSHDPEYTLYRNDPHGKNLLYLAQSARAPDAEELRQKHEEEHGVVGSDVMLAADDLERLNFVLQAPSGGLIDDPPSEIGDYLLSIAPPSNRYDYHRGGGGDDNMMNVMMMGNESIALGDAERELRKHLELELLHIGTDDNNEEPPDQDDQDDREEEEEATDVMANLSLNDNDARRGAAVSSPRQLMEDGKSGETTSSSSNSPAGGEGKDGSNKTGGGGRKTIASTQRKENQRYHKELSYTNLRGTTILLKPNSHPDNNNQHHHQNPTSLSATGSQASTSDYISSSPNLSTHGRLHDLHVSDCSDAHMYLLQPFEHATIAACTGCTIVVGAVAGLLHVVDCERTTITSAARRVLVSNSFDVLHCIFTPSPPLLVGDNRNCQFAPYNTYYDGLREDLLATGLAAAIVSFSTPPGDYPPHGGGGGGAGGDGPPSPALQCASNKWKQPIELAKLELPQVHPSALAASPTASGSGSSGGTAAATSPSSTTTTAAAPGADDKAVSASGTLPGASDDTMQTPILLPASEFHVLFVPLETELARLRRQQEEESVSANSTFDEMQLQTSGSGGGGGGGEGGFVSGRTSMVPSSNASVGSANSAGTTGGATTGSGSNNNNSSSGGGGPPFESQYCRNLADVLQLSPFRLPVEYERRALVKADRMRTLQQAILKDLTPEQQISLQEELNRGFRDWLVTSGNLRQVLDLVHMERSGAV